MIEPLSPDVVRRLITIAMDHRDNWDMTTHAVDEMFADAFVLPDVVRCLRGGVVGPGELRRGTFRYPVANTAMIAPISFTRFDPAHLVVVTVMRVRASRP